MRVWRDFHRNPKPITLILEESRCCAGVTRRPYACDVARKAAACGGSLIWAGFDADMLVACGTDECRWWRETTTSCEFHRKHTGYNGLLRRGWIKWTDYPSPRSPFSIRSHVAVGRPSRDTVFVGFEVDRAPSGRMRRPVDEGG